MQMVYINFFTYFLVSIIVVSANDGARSYCGTYLMQELRSVCRSHYNGYDKRSYVNYPEINENYLNVDYNELADFIFDKEKATYSLLNGNYYKRHTKVRTLVDECCNKPCSRATLRLYCQNK